MSTPPKPSPSPAIHHLEYELRPKKGASRHSGIERAYSEWWVLAKSRKEAQDTACSMIEYDGWDIVAKKGHEVQETCPYSIREEEYTHYQIAERDESSYMLKAWPKKKEQEVEVQ